VDLPDQLADIVPVEFQAVLFKRLRYTINARGLAGTKYCGCVLGSSALTLRIRWAWKWVGVFIYPKMFRERGKGMTFRDVWNDPVWSKVIGGLIVPIILAIFAALRTARFRLAIRVLFGSTEVPKAELPAAKPKVTLINVNSPAIDPNPATPLIFPLKCYIEMRNDSDFAIDVRMTDYRRNTIDAKRLALEVLQIKFDKWFPVPTATDRVGVYPGQQFRVFIPIDEHGSFTNSAINNLRGKIGTLVLSVNGEEMLIPF
jgi:hypothetical protein